MSLYIDPDTHTCVAASRRYARIHMCKGSDRDMHRKEGEEEREKCKGAGGAEARERNYMKMGQ